MMSQRAVGLVEQLAAEGVQSWLAVEGGPHIAVPDQLPHTLRAPAGVLLPAHAPPDPQAVRRLCERARAASVPPLVGSSPGLVSAPVDPAYADDAPSLVRAARSLRAAVDRPNLLVQIPATEAGLEAMSECLALGISVNATLICTVEQADRVFDALLDGMERALVAGTAPVETRVLLTCPVGLLDDVGVPDVGVATPGIAMARLLYALRERRLRNAWWRVLRAGSVAPPTLLWSSLRTHHLPRLIGWNTGVALTAHELEAAASGVELAGDVMPGVREGEKELLLCGAGGGAGPRTAPDLLAAELTRCRDAWHAAAR
ncbi:MULTISPECIES: transaldolase family protein [unclassified Streptomyces]|uniref:transaldolase family protein n=1 Tax=unclassified Streptomyces TaxID=2593676 RepID=UPI001CBABA63|nr:MULTISPECIES: transaldolase family protein [unclassified Streptomyces]WPO70823.1 transaldolase family protein [Streptomyces sp. KN37]